jgi:hypothetical protein
MKSRIHPAGVVPVTFLILIAVVCAGAQDAPSGKHAPIDQSLKTAFELLPQKKYSEAKTHLENALAAISADRQPSEWLFTKIVLPDEDPDDARSKDANVRQITMYRHSMGTMQAVLSFLAFTSQLQGDKAEADKYFAAVYKLQGPLWGTSWRTFVPLIQGVYYSAVPNEPTENYGRFLYLSGLLMDDADAEIAEKFFVRANELVPKDAEIAANLASYYVVRLRAAEAKKLAKSSLSIAPNAGRVLIDLATAEWLLGEIDDAEQHAREAAAAVPELPGPHGTLALVAVAKNNLALAGKEAATGVKLSDGHPYYLSIQAIVNEASGKSSEADRNIKDAWNGENPSAEQLKKWFLKDKPLELILKVIARQQAGNPKR